MNIEEIKAAILAGKKVCFECSNQLVVMCDEFANPLAVGLGVHNLRHNVTMMLSASELVDCFIYGE